MTRAMTRRLKGVCGRHLWVMLFFAFATFFSGLNRSLIFVFSRDIPKPKRRAPPRQKDKKDKEKAPKKEKEVSEIKVEDSDSVESVEEEVKVEEVVVEDPDGPRK